jgi:hypothetical protein
VCVCVCGFPCVSTIASSIGVVGHKSNCIATEGKRIYIQQRELAVPIAIF